MTAGIVSKTLSMRAFNAELLTAFADLEDIASLLDAMNKASTATVISGENNKRTVSLAGSTKVLNSFRTCAGTHDFANLRSTAGTISTARQ